uniref:Uncharacterized protein n=1 Tax=uncultured euryarchaeote Alv-FOS4 TaxID=337893 RepID=Q3SA58_9EURY|nr:hypothetical protein [uncultured euryarchaeote Alv-FOS4]
MKVIIKREFKKEHITVLKKSIRRKYGRFEKVKALLASKGCASPGIGEAYLIYLCTMNEEPIEEEVIIKDKKVFNVFSAKRFEMIDYINNHGPLSLKELARKTGRDYKNVYDDIYAMERFLILNVVKSGKEKVPIGKINSIEIRI